MAAAAGPSQDQLNKWCTEASTGAHTSFEVPVANGTGPSKPAPFGEYHSGSGFVVNDKGKYVVAYTKGTRPFNLLKIDDRNASDFEGKTGVPAIFYAILSNDENLVDLLITRAPYGSYHHSNCLHKIYHADDKTWHDYAPSHVASDNGKLGLSLRLDDWKPPSDIDVHCAAAWYGKLQHFQTMRAGDKKQMSERGGVDGQKLVWDIATKRYTLAKLATYKGTDCDREPIFFAAAAGHTAIVQWFASQEGVPGQTTTFSKPIHAVRSDGHGGFVLVEDGGSGGSGSTTPDGAGVKGSGSSKKSAADGKTNDNAATRTVTPADVAKANAHADTAHALEGGNRNCQTCNAGDCVIS